MKNKMVDLLLLHITLLFYSMGSVCSKFAATQQFMSLKFLIYYGIVLFILFAYAIIWQQILKKFDLTVAYANKAIVIAWGILWGVLFFHEKVKWNMIFGAIIIIAGICLVVSDSE